MGAVGRARASVAALRVLAGMRRQARTVATDEERVTLAGWSGWGPLAPMFAPKDDTWVQISDEVRELLPAPDVETGHRGTYNAFYTPPDVAAAMWRLLGSLGFTGGAVLEPGCGGGAFMASAPAGVDMVGVERDPTAAAICQVLYPDAQVIAGDLQSTRLPGGYAAAIGNVPFGDVKIFDPAAPDGARQSLHNYFIWRAVSALAPGGIAVLITSRYTMDAGQAARAEIAHLADFVGAVRLPGGALGGGTDICADVLILRRKDGAGRSVYRWTEIEQTEFGPLNPWWVRRPEMVLGEFAKGRTPRYGLALLVNPRAGDPPAAQGLTVAGAAVAADAREHGLTWSAPPDVTDIDGGPLVSPQGWHEGSIREVGGAVVKVEGGRLVPVARAGAELRALLGLRDLAVELVEMESDHSIPDADIAPLRQRTAAAYAAYRKRYGALNRCTISEGPEDEETGLATYRRTVPQLGGFRSDPDAALVFALEIYDQDDGTDEPAPILSARQNVPARRAEHTDDPAQALAWCLDMHAGAVDVDYIGGLLRVDPGTVPGLLGDAVYQDPGTRVWLPADEYLSGDVRVKHAAAVRAAEADPAFTRNVDALAGVLPAWLGPGDIVANLGAPWLGAPIVRRFLSDILGAPAIVRRLAATNQWEVDAPTDAKESVAATAEWGTEEVNAYRLVGLALNGQVPVVYRLVTLNGETVSRKDPDASLLAAEKQQRLRERFAEWVWEDPDRAETLTRIYNEQYNNLAPRRFPGEHVTVAGLAPWFKPYAHQREFVARALSTPAALCGHPVGAGKTASMAMLAMKLRQTGLARKPMVVVPNHLIEQITREFRQLFPAARILSASAKTVSGNRRAFTARCATSDWDMVVVTHDAFNRMPVAPDTERHYLEGQLEALAASIRDACPDGKLTGRMVKAAAKRLDAMRERIDELRHLARGRDRGVTFEQTGCDYLIVDEAHYYKNLAVPCRTDGFSVRPSKRATNLDVVLSWLARRGSGRYAALFTGTPVSNTMLELYVVLHYLMPGYMEEIGLGSADAWAATYVQFVTSIDVTVDGGQFALKTRPALFVNAPELRMLLSQVADIRTADQLGLKRPGCDERTVVVQPTTAQHEYSARLVARAEAAKGGGRNPGKGADNMLAVCGDGRRMATDPALVGLDDPEPGKLDRVADEITAVWRQYPDELQIGFCDVGTPNADTGTQTYGRLRRLLTDRGMDARRIRFIHDAASDAAKAALFAECRSGRVSLIMGSTDKLGVGTNIQTRVVAMHHVDAPYRPADVEQRDGRGLRPGNRHAIVRVYRYVTERTFDAYMWQMLTRKIGFISQVTSGKVDRTIEDVAADTVMSFAAIKAAATGQPLLLEKAEIDSEVKRLRNAQRGHKATRDRLRRDLPRQRDRVKTAEAELAAWIAIAEHAAPEVSEADTAQLFALMEQHGWRNPSGVVAGVRVRFGDWRTDGDSPERHPLAYLSGGDAEPVTARFYSFWKPERAAEELRKLIKRATDGQWALRQTADRTRAQIIEAEEMLSRPFEQAAELARALARLDQIEAAMHAAALGRPVDLAAPDAPAEADETGPDAAQVLAATLTRLDDIGAGLDDPADGSGQATGRPDDIGPAPAAVPVPEAPAAPVDADDSGDVDDIFGELMDSLAEQVERDFADLFGDAFV